MTRPMSGLDAADYYAELRRCDAPDLHPAHCRCPSSVIRKGGYFTSGQSARFHLVSDPACRLFMRRWYRPSTRRCQECNP